MQLAEGRTSGSAYLGQCPIYAGAGGVDVKGSELQKSQGGYLREEAPEGPRALVSGCRDTLPSGCEDKGRAMAQAETSL